jgi:hypothetical protein|tara:strand:- start:11239 stop:11829 length:591 start_codon:yes stop_codon:yes gene_type:complete
MITFLEYYKLIAEAPTTYQDRRSGESNSATIQNPPPAPVPPGPSDPTAQRWGQSLSNNRELQAGRQDPEATVAASQPQQPVGSPQAPVDLNTAGDLYARELQDLMSSGMSGPELAAAWQELYGRINADVTSTANSNREINNATREEPMGAHGVPDVDRQRSLSGARTRAINYGQQQGIVDSRQVRKLKDGNLILVD